MQARFKAAARGKAIVTPHNSPANNYYAGLFLPLIRKWLTLNPRSNSPRRNLANAFNAKRWNDTGFLERLKPQIWAMMEHDIVPAATFRAHVGR